MGRSDRQPQCASSAEIPTPEGSPNAKLHKRKQRGKTQFRATTDKDSQSEPHRHSSHSVPIHPQQALDCSPSADGFQNPERPTTIPHQDGEPPVTEASPAGRFMAGEVLSKFSMDAFIEWCRVRIMHIYGHQKPHIDGFIDRLHEWRCKAHSIIQHAWPPLRRTLVIVGGIAGTIMLSWLNCAIQGLKSFFQLGWAALFMIICCSLFNLGIIGGFFKLLLFLVLSAAAAFFLGYIYALAIFGIYSGVILWFYGSFWVTTGVLLLGGFLFVVDQPRPALLIGLLYSIYSAKTIGGWLLLFLCLNIAFVLGSLIVYLMHPSNSDDSSTHQESTGAKQGYWNESKQGYWNESNKDRARKGKEAKDEDAVSCTGGLETLNRATSGELSAIDREVERLLSCKDHYAVLELSRFADVDLVMLKKDYRKKAMLVHPDKNLGNSVAEEAFKRLQNAYEVLLDPLKKKGYDDELKREEVLLALKRFQEEVLRNGRMGTSDGWSFNREDDRQADLATRRIVCKKCGNTHRWICTDRNKLRARWCQECQDHHQAKDGDGWVEQIGHAFFFGMLHKVDIPRAYACADSKIYEVTEWVNCQGMKYMANTHKPSFHVSTAGIFKNQSRGPTKVDNKTSSSSGNNNADAFPFAHMNKNMTEEEFLKWLENAMASGMFHDTNEAASDQQGDAAKFAARSKSSKKKRKGKSKW